MENKLQEMVEAVNLLGYDIHACITDYSSLVFEERVKMNCFYCGKYGTNWKCPPQLPPINYQKMISEFDNIALVYVKLSLSCVNYEEVRNESSVKLHRALLECEKWLYKNNNATALSFIGGSCKLCKNGCAQDKCANPYMSRTPVEALGINIIQSAQKRGIKIDFPPSEYMLRVGLLLW